MGCPISRSFIVLLNSAGSEADGVGGDKGMSSLLLGVGGGLIVGFSNAAGGGDVTNPFPQKKNVVLRMNNPRSAKNGSLPCMMVTFA